MSSTTTLFVFAIGIALTVFVPRLGREDLSARNLIQKGLGAVLITIESENAIVAEPAMVGDVGRPSIFAVSPRKAGPVDVKISFFPEIGTPTSTSVSFKATQDTDR